MSRGTDEAGDPDNRDRANLARNMGGLVEVFVGPALEAQVLRSVLEGAGLVASVVENNDQPPTASLQVPREYAKQAQVIVKEARKGFGGPLDATMRD